MGAPLFQAVQNSCVQCEIRRKRPFRVKMGPSLNCVFDQIRLFSFMSLDLKGPITLKEQQVYVLVAVCLQTKFCEFISLDNRSTQTIISALNVVFSLYGSPSLILSDKEGGMSKLQNNVDKINESLLVNHQVEINLIPAFLHHLNGSAESKVKQLGLMLGTLSMESSGLTPVQFSTTLRILSNYANKQPYFIQFVSNRDKGMASGFNHTTSSLEFISPISFLNPVLSNTFQPILVDDINSSQKILLHRLGLTEKIYKDEILPKLLISLDYKRVGKQDTVKLDQIVLLPCTAEQNKKFQKAILARVVKVYPSRDGADRVVELEYFKERDCRVIGDKLVGSATRIVRGLESLYMLNQDALEACKIREFLKDKCCPPQDLPPASEPEQEAEQREQDTVDTAEPPTQEEEIPEATPLEEVHPDVNTMVWLERKEVQNQVLDQQQDQVLDEKQQDEHTQIDHLQIDQVQADQVNQDQKEQADNIHTQKEPRHDQTQMDHLQIDQAEGDQVDQNQEDPLHLQNQVTIRNQNQQQVEINRDPNVEFDIMPDNNIPHRITRSRNNISKKNLKYESDYVAL